MKALARITALPARRYSEQQVVLTLDSMEEERATLYVIADGVRSTFEFLTKAYGRIGRTTL